MEDFEKNEDKMENDSKFREEIYSKAVRAGKRTYFFDVKSTRRDEFYLTITESKKRFEQDGSFHFEKHKIFLYKEDFEKFIDGLQEVISYIDQNQLEDYDVEIRSGFEKVSESDNIILEEAGFEKNYSSIDFDDLSN
ncbi:MAG TPA: DNA-binding protein [Prolixibacteraceae bacterium]|nr:MAG: DNA-binding protein [Bacteroidetes bacterium GWB2_41_8]HCY42627.1 DNA-binding protein [Prolixibacteraceae bacterium]